MNEQENNSISKKIDVEYTEQDIREMREQGVAEDELPSVGVHTFRRSKFTVKRNDQKIKVSINLDADVLDFFKELAAQPNAASFEKQINEELREAMKRKQKTSDEFVTLTMLENPEFLSSLAEKLKDAT